MSNKILKNSKGEVYVKPELDWSGVIAATNKKPKKARVNRIEKEFDGHVFDSTTEFEFYQYHKLLMSELGIKEITIQPLYLLVEEYRVKCHKCNGTGKTLTEKTKKVRKCTRKICVEGYITKKPITYNADFKFIYEDGREVIIDVKGYRSQSEKFNLKKRLFEAKYGVELVQVFKDNGKWKWVV